MSNVLALIPARSGSKGIPYKNFEPLAGRSPVNRALDVCNVLGWTGIVSTDKWGFDAVDVPPGAVLPEGFCRAALLRRPAELAQDDTPMIAVVQHALAQIPGPPEQIIVLLQPTQPLRKPEHVTQAIALLEESGADSVVSVVVLPKTHSPDLLCGGDGNYLWPWPVHDGGYEEYEGWPRRHWADQPSRRQDVRDAYLRDGTVYTFRRSTVTEHGNIYGQDVRPLIIDPADTCPLDTPADWIEAERRLRERDA